jgi:hypothetical protein
MRNASYVIRDAFGRITYDTLITSRPTYKTKTPVGGGTSVAQGVSPVDGLIIHKPRRGDTIVLRNSLVPPLRGLFMVRAIHRACALGYTCITPYRVLLSYVGLLAIRVSYVIRPNASRMTYDA